MKVCFISNNIYPFLSNIYDDERIGGAELQQAAIGQALQRTGYEVAFITQDYGQLEAETVRGFIVHKTFKENDGLPGIRFFYPRLSTLWNALRRANADVYYTRGASFLPGILAIFCRKYRKKFIFAGASDTDFMPHSLLVPTLRDKLLYSFGLKRACAVIVQSERQRSLLWKNYRIEGEVIRNFLLDQRAIDRDSGGEFILWVSTIRDIKQPMHFLRLAESFPSEQFLMIGGVDKFSPALFDEVGAKAQGLPNLRFLGFQPFEKTEEYFDQAKVFVNTSSNEGFPNTFLQAWRRGIPVISYVDPDDIIKKNGLGCVADSEKGLRTVLSYLLTTRNIQPASIAEYYEANHTVKVITAYHGILKRMVRC